MKLPSNRQSGFTLIELMIVVVILGILVTVALPSYQRSIVRSNRADAQAALLGFAQAMERRFTQNYSYEAAAAGGGDTGSPDPSVFPSQSPIDGNNPAYNLRIDFADDARFTIQAVPIAGARQDGDGLLQLDSLGRRAWDKNNNGAIATSEFTWDQ
ncbi:type IV pilin protein [Congregibacter sp.]|uniref:type IV pilin protein n=1 Tax=Congregibacter sp. TaxID=2744308 RepID=UPI003F6B1A0B